jgi:hypothetical protein
VGVFHQSLETSQGQNFMHYSKTLRIWIGNHLLYTIPSSDQAADYTQKKVYNLIEESLFLREIRNKNIPPIPRGLQNNSKEE